jgi:hypothetical protein
LWYGKEKNYRRETEGEIMPDMIFFDDRELRDWAAALKRFPRESGKWAAKMINDMAFDMRDSFPSVMNEKYTIRDEGFINSIFYVEKARTRPRPEDIQAHVGTLRRIHFSGFTEEYGAESKKLRVITRWGRKGQ